MQLVILQRYWAQQEGCEVDLDIEIFVQGIMVWIDETRGRLVFWMGNKNEILNVQGVDDVAITNEEDSDWETEAANRSSHFRTGIFS